MEFRIAADELKKALYRAQGIVERKTTMPILANVLISAAKSTITVTAFDLDTGVVSEQTDLYALGVRRPEDLVGRDPDDLYERSCKRQGVRVDRCLLYVYRCAVNYATHRP